MSVPLVCLVSMLCMAGPAQVEWQVPFDAMPVAPTLYHADGKPIGLLTGSGTRLVLVDGTGRIRFETELVAPIAASPTVADLDGEGFEKAVVLLEGGMLCCLSPFGSWPFWTYDFDTHVSAFDVSTAADVHPHPGLEIIVGFADGWLNCLSAEGKLLWRFFGDKYSVGPCAVGDADGDGQAEIVYGTDNGNIYCLSGLGEVEWRYSEFAPYGRSGINLADLDNDGKAEVLVTRSNVGLDRCLMALDGATGAFLWRTQDVMQGYCSNATVDLDGDGTLETLHADKGNWLYCVNADGTERWRVELAGRGIFWAQAVADFDGDGALEILVPIRDTDPKAKACFYLIDADGSIAEALTIGSSGNASPAVADLDGDGLLEAYVCTKGPTALQALSWGGTGEVAWPSLRGDAAMTARRNVAAGKPAQARPHQGAAPIEMAGEPLYLGANTVAVSWEAPCPNDAFTLSSVRPASGPWESRVTPLDEGTTTASLTIDTASTEESEVVVELWASGMNAPLARHAHPFTPRAPEACGYQAVAQACQDAIARGKDRGADTSPLALRLAALDAERRMVAESGAGPAKLAASATRLRAKASNLATVALALAGYWDQGGRNTFVIWPDSNPWDHFDPDAMPEALVPRPNLNIPALINEREDAVLNLLNISGRPIEVRCTFLKPELAQKRVQPEPELAARITLRRGVRVPSHQGGLVLDALPELDRSGVLTLPPWHVTQLWLVADTYGLAPGEHELTLYIGSLEEEMRLAEVPLVLDVADVELPIGVYAQMNWVGIDVQQCPDQQLRDMTGHGISVAYGPPLPGVPLDEEGHLAGPIDWTRTDAGLDRLPAYFQLLFHNPPSLQWPEGKAPPKTDEAYERGYAAALNAMVKHFSEKGWGYDRWAFYPYDEPWLTGPTLVPALRAFCERVKAVDPKIRIYTDPAGYVRAKFLEPFKDLIDIWQPEMNLLKRDPELLRWFQENAKTFWAYEATDPGKDLLPLGYYRAYAWIAWHFGLDGAGFWCYKYADLWWPLEQTHWGVVYPSGGEVVPSRRWEAVRDGQEDFRLFHALRTEIERARGQGQNDAAQRAQALLKEAIEEIVGWQVRNIDEITRQTRDYEIDYAQILHYREAIVEALVNLSQKK